MKITGAKIIVTGAAGGLGLKTVEVLSSLGARVVGLDIQEPSPEAWKGIAFIRCDITREDEINVAVAAATKALGGVDILINNAGMLALQDAALQPTIGSISAFDVNFWGLWKLTAKFMPHLLASSGKLINVASLFAYVNAPLIPSYSASKRAVSAFSDALRMQYGDTISVTTVYPGFINTGIHKDAVRQGLSVETIVDIKLFGLRLLKLEEPLESAAHGIVRACKRNYRDVGTTRMGSLSLWFARHLPGVVDAFILLRINHLLKRGALKIELDHPVFE
jgi:NAD(P)-dependent dehydrogenase (short-subunit alcohol dehydrogenase family)